MPEQMRKEFEEWGRQHEIDLTPTKHIGTYNSLLTNNYWRVWQASRQSQMVKLPPSAIVFGEKCVRTAALKKQLDVAGVRYE